MGAAVVHARNRRVVDARGVDARVAAAAPKMRSRTVSRLPTGMASGRHAGRAALSGRVRFGPGVLLMPDDAEQCALCCGPGPLQGSHIIPAFVFRYLRDTSVGLMRTSVAPNRRVQDGPTIPLLCVKCEGRLGKWALPFAVSVSWRTVQFFRRAQGGQLAHLTAEQMAVLCRAEEAWADVMLGKAPHPGEFEQHIYPLDTLAAGTPGVSPMINRYFLRATDLDVVAGSDTVFVYTKLLRLIVIGFVRMPRKHGWHGGKLHVRRGVWGTRAYRMPGLMARYLSSRADRHAVALRSLSERQREKTSRLIDANLDAIATSEAFRAMAADVDLAGDAAFRISKPDDG